MEPKKPAAWRRLTQMTTMTKQSQETIKTQQGATPMPERPDFFSDSARPENSEDVPYPLSEEEALWFLETKLDIRDPKALVAEDRVKVLDLIVDRIKKMMPFTNIHHFLGTPLWEMDDLGHKELMLSLEGGPCWLINPFTMALLRRLGYNAYLICGHNPGDPANDTHVGTIVEDAAYPGSLHLIEPGTRRPLSAAIPLDFEKESPDYKFHYLSSKFFKEGERVIWCARTALTKPGDDYTIYDSCGRPWRQQVTYLLREKRNWSAYLELSRKAITATGGNVLPPFNGLVFFAYRNEEQIVSVLAHNDSIVVHLYDGDGTYQRAAMSKPALLQLIQENFPQYSEERLREVFKLAPIN